MELFRKHFIPTIIASAKPAMIACWEFSDHFNKFHPDHSILFRLLLLNQRLRLLFRILCWRQQIHSHHLLHWHPLPLRPRYSMLCYAMQYSKEFSWISTLWYSSVCIWVISKRMLTHLLTHPLTHQGGRWLCWSVIGRSAWLAAACFSDFTPTCSLQRHGMVIDSILNNRV